ncbi:MAG TPA: protein ndvB, partial [Rhizomicrobium sp.]
RKRGKLHEFNQLTRGSANTSFLPNQTVPGAVRYVVVVDSDTRLPRDAVRRLVGKMAHPLNQPTFDADLQRVIDGYAILQPRVTPALPTGSDGSLFQTIFSGTSGMDPYACAVSDLYQDLFGEGSYCGKGIYDIDAFEAALAGRIPENTLLSHDLLEGIFARAGLVSDIELIDEFPAKYGTALARQHRWVRGDWQLLPWIFGRRKVDQGTPRAAAMPLVGRWKMIDNLRRSLSAPGAFAALIGGFLLPPYEAVAWTFFVVGAIALPATIPVLTGLIPRRSGLSMRVHARVIGADFKLAASQVLLLVAFLPQYAWVMSDAILRTLFRLGVSHRNLLEWATAAQVDLRPRLDVAGSYRRMMGGVGLAVFTCVLCASAAPADLFLAIPFVALWLAAPAIARWISLPIETALPSVSISDAKALRLAARRTWHFFETFVTAEENMLPPDNFQEDPAPVIASRTSPTNLGLYLLSIISARDFGWLGLYQTVEKLEATLGTMMRMERFRGHFFNWYDTRSLAPLPPAYISSVDSGNLAGHLIALIGACNDLVTDPIVSAHWCSGIMDTLDLLTESTEGVNTRTELIRLRNSVDRVEQILKAEKISASSIGDSLGQVERETPSLVQHAFGIGDQANEAGQELNYWARSVAAISAAHQQDLHALLTWANAPADSPYVTTAETNFVPSLREVGDLCATAIRRITDAPDVLAASDTADVERSARIECFRKSEAAAASLIARIEAIRTTATAMFDAMEFGFLFDNGLELLSIGYRVSDASLDRNHYDLLASEARLASIVAIAKGDVPTRHWFRLGRGLAPVGWDVALLSWSGSMFEYLMPSLIMRAPFGSL